MKKAASFFLWTLITLILIFVALCFFPLFNISEIEVKGIESLTEEQVIDASSGEESHCQCSQQAVAYQMLVFHSFGILSVV